jgi:hypothetical protein
MYMLHYEDAIGFGGTFILGIYGLGAIRITYGSHRRMLGSPLIRFER